MSFNYGSTDSVTGKLSGRLSRACCYCNEEWLGSESIFPRAWKKAAISINESLLVWGSQVSHSPKTWEWLNFGQDGLFPFSYYFICIILNEIFVYKSIWSF